ncbi:MAG TPA: pantoate--beta-alanine ligase [Leptospiraceae bacterium]|nr:pantoate--beta-alanine ligase [Leptospiraceae bacterium]HRG75079.1 pantoate--beta-alanine ligase [Leptospiraceae bacterium]
MQIIKNKQELNKQIRQLKAKGKTVGFAPTMGFLHEGHTTLFTECKANTDITVTSIFVNPAQFNDPKDYEKYPRNTESDLAKCKEAGVDIVYLPEVEDIYPEGKIPDLTMKIPHLMKSLCATTRPGHFEGVLLVISNLFHSVEPDIAFFGLKDYQQFLIIKEFARVTGFNMDVVGVETIRESDGLAMSSRNARLSKEDREAASLIPRAFKLCRDYIFSRGRDPKKIRSIFSEVVLTSAKMRIDYIEILNAKDLSPLEELTGEVLIAVAIFCGEVRLIDNIRLTLV